MRSLLLSAYVLMIHHIFYTYSYSLKPKLFHHKFNHVVQLRMVRRRGIDVKPETPSVIVGEDLPDEIKNHNAIYDMILVERISQPEKTSVGLILPKIDGKDQKHLGKVLSIPTDYGLEGENGRVAPVSEIIPYKVGDIVYIRVSLK